MAGLGSTTAPIARASRRTRRPSAWGGFREAVGVEPGRPGRTGRRSAASTPGSSRRLDDQNLATCLAELPDAGLLPGPPRRRTEPGRGTHGPGFSPATGGPPPPRLGPPVRGRRPRRRPRHHPAIGGSGGRRRHRAPSTLLGIPPRSWDGRSGRGCRSCASSAGCGRPCFPFRNARRTCCAGAGPATSWDSRCSCASSANPGRLLAPGEFVPPAVMDFQPSAHQQLQLAVQRDPEPSARVGGVGPREQSYAGGVQTPHVLHCHYRPPAPAVPIPRAARRVSSATGSAKKRNGHSRTRIWCAGSRPAVEREPSSGAPQGGRVRTVQTASDETGRLNGASPSAGSPATSCRGCLRIPEPPARRAGGRRRVDLARPPTWLSPSAGSSAAERWVQGRLWSPTSRPPGTGSWATRHPTVERGRRGFERGRGVGPRESGFAGCLREGAKSYA